MRERAMGRGGVSESEVKKPSSGVRRTGPLESRLKSKFVLQIIFSFVALVLLMQAMKARGGGITFSSPRQITEPAGVDGKLDDANSGEEGAVTQLDDATERASESGGEGVDPAAINGTFEQEQPPTEQTQAADPAEIPGAASAPPISDTTAAAPGAPVVSDTTAVVPGLPPVAEAPGAPLVSDPVVEAPGAPPVSDPAAILPGAPAAVPPGAPAAVPPGAPAAVPPGVPAAVPPGAPAAVPPGAPAAVPPGAPAAVPPGAPAAVPPGAPAAEPPGAPAAVPPGAPAAVPPGAPAAVLPGGLPISDATSGASGAPPISEPVEPAVELLSPEEAEAALAEAHALNPNTYQIPGLPDFDVIPQLPVEWPDRQQLGRLAAMEENKGEHQRIIVAAVSCNFLDVADNWLSSLERNRVWNYLIVSLDEVAYDRLHAVRPDHVIKYPFSQHSYNATYGSDGFAAIVKSRPVWLVHLLRTGMQFLYSDVDMFYMENPFNVLPPGYDIVASTDSYLDQPPELTDKDGTNICTGLMYLAPTEMTFELMYRWNTILTRTERKINQVAFNLALVDMGHTARSDPRIKLSVLDKEAFPPGFMYFGNKDWQFLRQWQPKRIPVMVHNNYTQAKENKVSRFKDFDLWYPEVALENCKGGV